MNYTTISSATSPKTTSGKKEPLKAILEWLDEHSQILKEAQDKVNGCKHSSECCQNTSTGQTPSCPPEEETEEEPWEEIPVWTTSDVIALCPPPWTNGSTSKPIKMKKLLKRTLKWADNRGILDLGTLEGQAKKFAEESAETVLAAGKMISSGSSVGEAVNELADGIGDTLVTLAILAEMAGLDLAECWDGALEVIEAREGEMKNGVFKKNE